MGQLGPTDSFGEVSIIGDEPMNCSIVTATKVELACIEPPKLKGKLTFRSPTTVRLIAS